MWLAWGVRGAVKIRAEETLGRSLAQRVNPVNCQLGVMQEEGVKEKALCVCGGGHELILIMINAS